MLNSNTSAGQVKVAGFAIVLYAAWNARSLIDAWLNSPFDHVGIAAWMVWMIPVLIGVGKQGEARLTWFAAALLLIFAGALLDLNLLKYLALAAACAGLTNPRRTMWIWVPASLAWMPAFGWFLSKYDINLVLVSSLRVLVAAAGTISYFSTKR